MATTQFKLNENTCSMLNGKAFNFYIQSYNPLMIINYFQKQSPRSLTKIPNSKRIDFTIQRNKKSLDFKQTVEHNKAVIFNKRQKNVNWNGNRKNHTIKIGIVHLII